MYSGCGATMVRERATQEQTRPATMLCKRAIREEYCVVVEFPKPFSERCASVKEHCVRFCPHIFLALFAFAFYWCFWWILVMASHCHQTPGLGLEELTIRDMTVYQNSTTDTDTTWLVRSDINVNLATWNPNTVSNCFTTYRRMVVHVFYKGQLLLQQEVPLGFKLKPQGKRPVVLELQEGGYAVQQEEASLLQRELRKARVVELQFSFDTRFSRNDNKTGWMGMSCKVIVKTPTKSSLQLNSLRSAGGLVRSSCKPS